jgi:putative transposase
MKNSDRQETLKAVLHYFYQNNAKSGSHCRYSLQYHFVWIPKYRRKVLVEPLAKRLKEILREICRDYRFRIIAMEVMPDHVHMLIEAPPKVSPTRIIQTLKSISARRMRMEFDKEIQKYIWKPGTLWAVGYYVGSVSDKVTTEIVQEYIKNQKTEKQRHIEFEERLDQKNLFDES